MNSCRFGRLEFLAITAGKPAVWQMPTKARQLAVKNRRPIARQKGNETESEMRLGRMGVFWLEPWMEKGFPKVAAGALLFNRLSQVRRICSCW